MKLTGVTKGIRKSLKKHAPEILTGIGIAGMVSAAVMAVRSTPKALRLMDDEVHYRLNTSQRYEDEEIEGLVKVDDSGGKNDYGHYRLPYKDTVKLVWKCYIPSAATTVLSAACLIGASSVHIRRNAVLATAYSLSETAFREYSEKVVENIGEKKEREIRDSVAEDKIKKDPVSKKEVIITGKGDTLCHDSYTGRYFRSDIEKIKRAVNELGRRMKYDDYISLNDFYYELGLDEVTMGDDLGWNISDGFLEVNYSSCLADDGTPCLDISYTLAPKYDYYR